MLQKMLYITLFVPLITFGMEQPSLKDISIDTMVENITRYTPEAIATLPADVHNVLMTKAVLNTIGSAPGFWERSFKAHQTACCCSCITADNYLITGSHDHSLKVFDAAGNMQAHCVGHTGEVWSVCVSHDNKIVSGSADNTVCIWDRQGNLLATCVGHTDEVYGVCITKDNCIVSCSADNTVRVWDMEGNQKYQYNGHASGVMSVCVSHDNKIVSGAEDGAIHICTIDGTLIAQYQGHTDSVHALCMSHDNHIISGSVDWSVRLWSIDGQPRAFLTSHKGPIISLCVTAENQVVSGSHDRTIRITDMSGQELAFCKIDSSPNAIAMASRNHLVISSMDGQVSFYDISCLDYLKNMQATYAARVWAFLRQMQEILNTGYVESLNTFTCWARIKAIKDEIASEELQQFYDGLEPLVEHSLTLSEVSDDYTDTGDVQPMDLSDDMGFEKILNQQLPVDQEAKTEEVVPIRKRFKQGV